MFVSMIGSMIFGTFMDDYGIADLFSGRFSMLIFDVSFAIGFGSKSKITNRTLKGFFSSVSAHMSSKGGLVVRAVCAGDDL